MTSLFGEISTLPGQVVEIRHYELRSRARVRVTTDTGDNRTLLNIWGEQSDQRRTR